MIHMRVSRCTGIGCLATRRLLVRIVMGLAHQMLGDKFFADFCIAGTIELLYDGIALGRRKMFVDKSLFEFEVS